MSGHGWDIDGYLITKVLYIYTSSVAVVVTTVFKPKSKLPVYLFWIYTVGNSELGHSGCHSYKRNRRRRSGYLFISNKYISKSNKDISKSASPIPYTFDTLVTGMS